MSEQNEQPESSETSSPEIEGTVLLSQTQFDSLMANVQFLSDLLELAKTESHMGIEEAIATVRENSVG